VVQAYKLFFFMVKYVICYKDGGESVTWIDQDHGKLQMSLKILIVCI